MELKNFSQEVNEQLFGKGSRQVSMGEFIDMSVSAHKSRSDEQNVIRETAAGNKIVIKPRRVRFNGIELSQEQFRALVDIPIEELSPVGFRNLLGAMSIYAPVMFKDKKIFSRTEEFAKSEIGRRALEYQRQQEEGFCVAEVDGMTNFIFTNRFGNPHNPQAVNRAIKRIVDTHNAEEEVEAKKKKREPIMLPRFSCHIFRHTFASRFCENETNVKVIQEVMGHADVSTTMNIYAEANPEVTREALEKLAKNMDVF